MILAVYFRYLLGNYWSIPYKSTHFLVSQKMRIPKLYLIHFKRTNIPIHCGYLVYQENASELMPGLLALELEKVPHKRFFWFLRIKCIFLVLMRIPVKRPNLHIIATHPCFPPIIYDIAELKYDVTLVIEFKIRNTKIKPAIPRIVICQRCIVTQFYRVAFVKAFQRVA